MIRLVRVMKRRAQTWICLLLAGWLAAGLPWTSAAKSYGSGGGHSYSSHSSSSHSSSHSSGFGGSSFSHSSSSGSSKSFSSSGGHSYSSGSSWSDSGRKSYTSGKSYSSGSSRVFDSLLHDNWATPTPAPKRNPGPASTSSGSSFAFDTAAARARKQEASKNEFARFKQTQIPPVTAPDSTYRVQPPPVPTTVQHSYHTWVYVPDAGTLATRRIRIYNVFNPYTSRPWVVYNDPYSSWFWWWLLDRSLDDRAWWAYHHRYDMDPTRYQALLATDQQLEARVEALEAQQAPRDPSYTPAGLDKDLMYSDQYVNRAYSNRPTTLGVVTFWVLGVPTALALCVGFIWLVWFKRWQVAPA